MSKSTPLPSPHPRRPLAAAAIERIALVVGVASLAMAALAGWLGASATLPVLAAITAATAASAAALWRRRSSTTQRLLTAGLAAYALNAAYYAAEPTAAERFPSLADSGLLLSYPLLLAAAFTFVRDRVTGLSAVRLLDCVLGALLVTTAGLGVLLPALGPVSGPVTGQLLFAVGDLLLLGFVLAAAAASGGLHARTLLGYAAGAGILLAADVTYVLAVAGGDASASVLVSSAWAAGLLALAASRPTPEARRVPVTRWSQVLLPVAAAVVGLPVALLAPIGSPQLALAVLVLALVVGRLTASLIQNGRLLAVAKASAVTDRLTGLPNRALLFHRLELAAARQLRRGGLVGVLFLDLDEFKAINDAHGHEVGDDVLTTVAKRLTAELRAEDVIARDGSRASDVVGRLGGDEFVVVLEGLHDPAQAGVIADRLLTAIAAPLVVGAQQLELAASIGIVLSDGSEPRSATDLLRDADAAMYEAKGAGKRRWVAFEHRMRDAAVARLELVDHLRHAVERNELRLVFQPQVDLLSGHMTGVEALVRWRSPHLGLLTPDRFLPVAEDAGLLTDIDDWVLLTACRQLRAWDAQGGEALELAVNVSAARLTQGDLVVDVAHALRETGVAPGRLEVEITETLAVEHGAKAVAAIRGLQALGVRVAIDDFGMGHSALSRLQDFPVDRLKIDRSFVSQLTPESARGSLADAMLTMGESLGLQVIAEGVETQENLQALRLLGCTTGQGYLFSRPVDGAAIGELVLASGPILEPAAVPDGPGCAPHDRVVRSLLAELQRVTGLESTYVTQIDWEQVEQHVTYARNTGVAELGEGLSVNWGESLCRRALEEGIDVTDDVGMTFGEHPVAEALGLRTYVTVPLLAADGTLAGTLCGASSQPVTLGPEALAVMRRFAEIIARSAGRATPVPVPRTTSVIVRPEDRS